MKKKIFTLCLVILVIIGITVSISTVQLNGIQTLKGDKSYDSNGSVNGCCAPGSQCVIVF